MSDTNKNRVTSSKTPRGSQNPHGYAGFDGIVQPAQDNVQPKVTIAEVKRILKLGKLLSSVLTPDERYMLYRGFPHHISNACDETNYVSSSILDEEHRVADDVKKLQV